jgi:hypothetical protein
METNPTRGRFGLMRPLPLSIAVTNADGTVSDNRTVSDKRCRFVGRDGSDGFLPVMTAAALIASAVIIALD